jgi:adenylate cyclase
MDADDTAALLAGAEVLILGDGPRFTPVEVWERVGVEEDLARNLWLAMGFPHVPEDEVAFTEADVTALHQAAVLLRLGTFDAVRIRQQTRIMSQAVSTIATAHAEALSAAVESGGLLPLLGEDNPLPVLDELLVYLYRRHLLAAVERVTLAPDPSAAPVARAVVGFADLTDFTAMSAAASESELTDVVDGFAGLAADAVATAGGRVVKLIGDEVMFSIEDPHRAADVALTLVEVGEDPSTHPPVHAGLALGTMLNHHGDLFGSTVNLASRLTDVARPGTVLVNDELAAVLADDAAYRVKRVHLRPLKGIGAVDAHAVRRAADDRRRPLR